ncbi:L-aminoadipate-semialdehyde dehydrogenase [Ceratobasidium theobromae]|uniref:L-aminoadipate-semialdehyde dehydrogenase n=1 Tax=Ceratobasidium theobromae TaxID=1582974 RepID=A0A5N5QIB5_9AGAM|nr:L-aminoadipate-semialdehyde dehydrogenase [Ceratobasidium theobromae]
MVVSTSGFSFPPKNGTVPPALAVDFHLKYNPNHLFAILHDVNDSSQIKITYELLAQAVHRAAHILNPNGEIPQGTNIGFLVSTNTIEYIIIILGAMRAGLVPFPISPRTHVPGIAHLLTSTETSLVVTGGSQSIDDITTQVQDILSRSDSAVKFVQLPALEDVLPDLGQSKPQAELQMFPRLKTMTNDSIVNILHSSGSTGMPRAVKYHLEGVFKNVVNQPLAWSYAGSDVRVGTMALPTFHAMGALLQVVAPLYVGYTQVLFAPGRIPVVPTSNLTIQAALGTGCSYLVCVPAFLEMWAQDEGAVTHLQQMKGIMFGGGPLADAIGNKLVEQGVPIHSCYGATEFGIINEIEDDLTDWGYVRFSSRVDAQFDPQHDEDDTYELVFAATEAHKPFVLNSELNGKPTYRTKDLVVRHPSKPNLWKLVGRLDDQIILLNGEKTNPGPMEAEIVKSPLVQHAIMFGRERNQTGVLIELEGNVSGRCHNKEDRTKLIEEIWPYVEWANQTSPTHSRLAKPTLIFVDPSRPLPRTPKGTIPRSAALKAYGHDIEEMYTELEKDSNDADGVEAPESWMDLAVVEAWVGKCVAHILGHEVDAGGDLFQQGMDSLTATILLRTLKGVLHASTDSNVQASAKKVNQQTIFGKPTVEQLARLLVQLCTNTDASTDLVAEALQEILAMIRKYDAGWGLNHQLGVKTQVVEKERVVVTGTTGGLGSHLLAQLLENDRVEKVWAMNRKSSKGNKDRQFASFVDKKLDVGLLGNGKLELLDTVLEDAKLGLSDEVYNEIRSGATIIVHNAWQVNFNLSLQSFEPSIRGAHNLLDLAFNSTAPSGFPRFAFASSISVAGFASEGSGGYLYEVSVSPENAAKSIGYAQSKLVTEKLLESAKTAGLETCIVRLGQLTGDAKGGAWTVSDWVPSLIRSSVSVGCLPAAVGTVSWLPLDVAAHSIIDTCTARNFDFPPIIHTSHPHPVPWMDVMGAFSEVLASRMKAPLPLVRFDEWNKRVTQSAMSFTGSESERYKQFPSTKIQSTVDGMVRADEELRLRGDTRDVESSGTVRLDTSVAEKLSEALSGTQELGREHVKKWVEYWGSMGLFF